MRFMAGRLMIGTLVTAAVLANAALGETQTLRFQLPESLECYRTRNTPKVRCVARANATGLANRPDEGSMMCSVDRLGS